MTRSTNSDIAELDADRVVCGTTAFSGLDENAIIRSNMTCSGNVGRNGQTDSCSALRLGDGSRHRRRGFRLLEKPILAAAGREYRHCLGVRSFLLEIHQKPMNGREMAPIRYDCALAAGLSLLQFSSEVETGSREGFFLVFPLAG
jgi:hypothetical protein